MPDTPVCVCIHFRRTLLHGAYIAVIRFTPYHQPSLLARSKVTPSSSKQRKRFASRFTFQTKKGGATNSRTSANLACCPCTAPPAPTSPTSNHSTSWAGSQYRALLPKSRFAPPSTCPHHQSQQDLKGRRDRQDLAHSAGKRASAAQGLSLIHI